MPSTFDEIMGRLRSRNLKPVYFLAGEEPYYIDIISDYIAENILSESEKSFNQIVLYGPDASIPGIIDTARRFPMMASHQVIIVREAQALKKIDELAVYIEKPLQSTVLVINYKYKLPDKRTRLVKLIEANGVYFESPKIRDYLIPGWIEKYLMNKGIKTDPSSSAMLTEYLGTDLSKIANELEKLIISLPPGKPFITTEMIQNNIGISKDYNNFELQKALAEKNILKSNRIIKYFADNPGDNPFVLTISSIFSFFSKLLAFHALTDKSKANVAAALKVNPYFVKDYELAASKYNINQTIRIISFLRAYDLRSKGFEDPGTDQGDLLKELIFKILHV